MTFKRTFLFVILSTYLISCSSVEKQFTEISSIKKSQDSLSQHKRIPKSLHDIRRNLKRLLSSLMQLQNKVEEQCPRKIKEVEATIERVKILLKKIKSKDPLARVKEQDLDLVRLEVQNFILSVRKDIADQIERKNEEQAFPNEEESFSQNENILSTTNQLQEISTYLEMKKEKKNVPTEVQEEFEIIEKKVLTLKEGWKNLLKKVENIKNFLAKCGAQEPSSCMIALHEKLCRDINGIYLKVHESIYHVSLIEDELNFFSSDEEETFSCSSLRSLRSDTIIEEKEFEKIQRRLDQFLSVQNIIPHYLFSDEENAKPQSEVENPEIIQQEDIDLSEVENPEIIQQEDIDLSEVENPEIIQQEDIDLLRKEFKIFFQQLQQFRIRIQSLQAFNSSFFMLKHLEEELSTAEQELRCFRSCLETSLEEFLNTGKIVSFRQQDLFQKKEVLFQKLTKLKQLFELAEKESIEQEIEQIQGMHLIEKGETLCSIAEKYGVFIEKILQINPAHKEPFKEGDLIKIPVQKETSLSIKEKT